MTSRSVSGFIEAAANDESLQAEWNSSETPEDLVGLAERHGYDFDAHELQAALDAVQRLQANELTDAQLEEAAGGGLPVPMPPDLSTAAVTKLQFYEGWPCKWLGATTRLDK